MLNLHGAVNIADQYSVIANGTVNISANTNLDLGSTSTSSFGNTLQTNNGNINLSAAGSGVGNPVLDIGFNSVIDATSQFSNLGNVTLTAGSGSALPVNVAIGSLGISGVNVNGNNAFTTSSAFTTNGSVTFDDAGSTIKVSNQLGAGAIVFEGGNTVIADPPAGAPAAPQWMVTGALPNSVSMLPSVMSNNVSMLAPTITSSAQSLNSTGISPTGISPTGISSAVLNNSAAPQTSLAHLALTAATAPSALSNMQTVGLANTALNSAVVSPAALNNTAATILNSTTSVVTSTGGADISRALAGGISKKERTNGHSLKYGAAAASDRQLENGAMLLAPERTTVVKTKFGNVQVADRAVVLVVANDKGLSVYNLDDSRRDSVLIAINGERLSLPPGRHITVTHESSIRFQEVNPAQYVGYRNLRTYKMNGELRAYQSEFNHMSVIGGLEPLQDLIKSNTQTSKKLSQHMFKTIALLNMMNVSPVPFETMSDSQASVTAMN